MPMHVGDNKDKGGNRAQVRFFDKGTNRPRLWDSDMIERVSTSEDVWLADLAALDRAENRKAWMAGSVEDWSTESLPAARAAYMVPGTEKRIKPVQKLGQGHMAIHMPVARRRLCQAGLKLAWVLNEALVEK